LIVHNGALVEQKDLDRSGTRAHTASMIFRVDQLRTGLLGLAICKGLAAALAAPELSPEDAARSPDVMGASLSPAGDQVAYLTRQQDHTALHYQDLRTRKVYNVRHTVGGEEEQIISYRWLGPDRVAFKTAQLIDDGYAHPDRTAFALGKRTGILREYTTGWSAMDLDGGRWVDLTGGARESGAYDLNGVNIIHTFENQNAVLMTALSWRGDSNLAQEFYPDVVRLDHVTGKFETVVKNPGDVVAWLPDRQGNIRFCEALHGANFEFRYRETAQDPWRVISKSEDKARAIVPLSFEANGRGVFVRALTPAGFWGLSRLDLGTGALQPVFSANGYDILPPESFGTSFDGMAMESLVYSHDQVVGLRYLTELPHVKWIEPHRAQAQVDVDAALPGKINTIVSTSDDNRRLLVLSWSDRDPGTYYTFDPETSTLRKFIARMPWIHPEEMAAMKPIHYQARDGLTIHGYLTLPTGSGSSPHALIMYIHGGPWARDTWQFEPMVQFLASRGYAVLQVNYRGSTGFGQQTMGLAVRQIGGTIQDDITDGLKWAIASGIADPARVAIMGASYGGYSALWGATRTPELYRCAIDISGPADWAEMVQDAKNRDVKYAYAVWSERIGSLKNDPARLKEISPINFAAQVRAPILIIHGSLDRQVPEVQSREMAAALKANGKICETIMLPNEEHSFRFEKSRLQEFRAVGAFLQKYLPAN